MLNLIVHLLCQTKDVVDKITVLVVDALNGSEVLQGFGHRAIEDARCPEASSLRFLPEQGNFNPGVRLPCKRMMFSESRPDEVLAPFDFYLFRVSHLIHLRSSVSSVVRRVELY